MSKHNKIPALLLGIMGLGPVCSRLGAPPFLGFSLFSGAGVGLIGFACVHGLRRLRAPEQTPLAPLLVAGPPALAFAAVAGAGFRAPALTDVSTNPDDLPRWLGADVPALEAYDAVHVETMRASFPGLSHRRVADAPADVFARVQGLVSQHVGWQVTWADVSMGQIEVVVTSAIFRFQDDVLIRVSPRGSGSRVDMRSRSRVGGGDRGANAARIIAFMNAFDREKETP